MEFDDVLCAIVITGFPTGTVGLFLFRSSRKVERQGERERQWKVKLDIKFLFSFDEKIFYCKVLILFFFLSSTFKTNNKKKTEKGRNIFRIGYLHRTLFHDPKSKRNSLWKLFSSLLYFISKLSDFFQLLNKTFLISVHFTVSFEHGKSSQADWTELNWTVVKWNWEEASERRKAEWNLWIFEGWVEWKFKIVFIMEFKMEIFLSPQTIVVE